MQQRYQSFTVLISGISRSIRRIKTEEMAEYNLKSPHVTCLYYIYKAEKLTFADLCAVCEEDKANISRSIKHLEQEGYVDTGRSLSKSRYHLMLTLTEKGLAVAKKLAERIDTVIESASNGVSDADREIMYRSLAIINANLQKVYESYIEDESTDEEEDE